MGTLTRAQAIPERMLVIWDRDKILVLREWWGEPTGEVKETPLALLGNMYSILGPAESGFRQQLRLLAKAFASGAHTILHTS